MIEVGEGSDLMGSRRLEARAGYLSCRLLLGARERLRTVVRRHLLTLSRLLQLLTLEVPGSSEGVTERRQHDNTDTELGPDLNHHPSDVAQTVAFLQENLGQQRTAQDNYVFVAYQHRQTEDNPG